MNTTEFLSQVRISGQLAPADPVYTDAVLLTEGTAALRDRFAEPLTTLRQGYGLHTLLSSTTAGTSFVRIPPRAVVQGLETVELSIDSGETFRLLNILTQVQANDFSPTRQDVPTHYTLEGDTIRLYPIPNGTYSVKFRYYLRQPKLIAHVATLVVATVPTSTSVTTTTNPSSLSISTSTGCDVQNFDGSHEVAIVSGTITSITGAGPYTINFDSSVSTAKVRAGDYIRLPDEAVFPVLPEELARPLCDYVAAMIWVSKGDAQKAAMLSQKADSGIARVVSMAQPRNKTGQFSFKRTNSYLRRNVGSW